MKMNLANKLTIFRIILVPIMVIVSFFDIPGSFLGIPTTMWILNLIFIIASITDKLDGYLARKNNHNRLLRTYHDVLELVRSNA